MIQEIGSICERCNGLGLSWEDEEYLECPYCDIRAGVACEDGKIVKVEEVACSHRSASSCRKTIHEQE